MARRIFLGLVPFYVMVGLRTSSRSSYLGLAAVLLLLAWYYRRKWKWLVVMAPIASYRRRGRLDALSIWLPFLALGTYVQSFATFHASGIEEMRHTMGASLMLRLSALMALVCIAKAFFADSTVSMDETPR